MTDRIASVERNTLETQIRINLNLDGTGVGEFKTGIPFFEHMLDQVSRHGLVDVSIQATGDLEIDDHHTVEDVGITLGQAFDEAVGDKKGMTRYGHAYVPLDEALSRVVIDFSGRPGLFYDIPFTRSAVGGFDVDLFREFFQGFESCAGDLLLIISKVIILIIKLKQSLKLWPCSADGIEPDPRMGGMIPSKGCCK